MDSNPTFFPSETFRSYTNARKIFEMMGRGDDISFLRFDLQHGYAKEDREAMLGWFDLHLKGTGDGSPRKELPFEQLPEEKLLVYPGPQRDPGIVSTDEYCRMKGTELRETYLHKERFNRNMKRKELMEILRIDKKLAAEKVYNYSSDGEWKRLSIETKDLRLIPLLLREPSDESMGYVIVCDPGGKKNIPLTTIDSIKNTGAGIIIEDLTGTGELTATSALQYDYTGKLHTIARAELWLGRTVLGEWVREMDLVARYLYTEYEVSRISIYGTREAGLAGLFYGALGGKLESVTLCDAPVSYLFDSRESVDYFSMGIHLPGFLKWGDLSLAAALSGVDVLFIDPVTMSGSPLDSVMLKKYTDEYDHIGKLCKSNGKTILR
jgi:hypothetical protein